MAHGHLWLFNMDMCCGMQIPVDGDTQKSMTIKTFPDLDDCLSWLGNESAARDKCVEMLDENC